MHDTRRAGLDYPEPSGLIDFDADELTTPLHPAEEDPLITDSEQDDSADNNAALPAQDVSSPRRGQRREPFEYGDILRAAGLKLSDHERDCATTANCTAYLIPFPKRVAPQVWNRRWEGLKSGKPAMRWTKSTGCKVSRSHRSHTRCHHTGNGNTELVPGAESPPPGRRSGYLCRSSGSMPNPQQRISYMALARRGDLPVGTAATRAGAGHIVERKKQFPVTRGFVRDEDAILRILTGHRQPPRFQSTNCAKRSPRASEQDRDATSLHISDWHHHTVRPGRARQQRLGCRVHGTGASRAGDHGIKSSRRLADPQCGLRENPA